MMFNKTSRYVLLLVCTVLLTGCGLEEPKPFDPHAMQRVYRERAAENYTGQLGPLPVDLDREFLKKRTGPISENRPQPLPTLAQSIGPAVRMSLRDLIQLAAINSLQVRVANYQAAIDEARVTEALAKFDPVFFSNFNFATQFSLIPTPQSPFTSGNNFFETTTLESGWKQNLPNGAQVQFKYTATRTFRTPPNPTNDPFFESDLSLQITQPLLQNAGTEVNMARVVVARNTQRVSLLDARLQLEKTLAEIEQLYWQLVQGEAELRIQEDLYEQSVQTAITVQYRLGQDATRTTVATANAALQARKAGLVEARYKLKEVSNNIKRRVNDPQLNSASAPVLLAEDQPVNVPIKFDLAEQIEAALTNRAELAQQLIRIESAHVVYKAAQNNLLPSLNLVGSIGLKGAEKRFGSALNNQFMWDPLESTCRHASLSIL